MAGPERLLPNVRGLVYDWATARRRMLWRRVIAPRAERILCVSRAAEAIVQGCAPAALGKTLVIENGVDVAAFAGRPDGAALRAEIGVSEKAYLIGTVGRLHPVKGHGDLVAALGLLAKNPEPPQVVIVGYAPEEERGKLVEQARELGVEQLLHFAGRRENIPEWLSAMDAFVLPSHSEGMPNALLEAMAAGLPAVATRVGGTVEVVEEGKTAVLVPAQAPEALAEALASLRRDPTRAADMGRAARAAMEARAWPAVVARYAEILFG